jgi:hypothetical protein
MVSDAGHSTVYEMVVKMAFDGVKYNSYLHVSVDRGAVWDVANPAPTMGLVVDSLWTDWNEPWTVFNEFTLAVFEHITLKEVVDTHVNASGIVVSDYGITADQDVPNPLSPPQGGRSYMPSFVQVYVRKRASATPTNHYGSIRLGAVSEADTDPSASHSMLTDLARVSYQQSVDTMLVPVVVAEPAFGNELNCVFSLFRKTPCVGTATPWSFTHPIDQLLVRRRLGSQLTRKRTR